MMEGNNDPSLDPNAVSVRPKFSQYDLEDHRGCTVYIGYCLPSHRRKSHRRHRHHHHRPTYSNNGEHDISKPVTPPAERVQFILGEDEEGGHEPHPLFSEMEELFYDENSKTCEWRETARWIKFEEDVEEGGNRWSKPHVATVSLHSLFEVRSCILNGPIIFDMVLDAKSLEEVIDLILDELETRHLVPSNAREDIKNVLLRPHRHQHQLHNAEWPEKNSKKPLKRCFTEICRNPSKVSTHRNSASSGSLGMHIIHNLSSLSFRMSSKNGSSPDESANNDNFLHKNNQSFLRKIPPSSETCNLLVGEVQALDKMVSCFIRLNESCSFGDLTEVPIPTRFIFVLLGPLGEAMRYHEIGRAMATLLSDEVFHSVAYKARTRMDLLAGVDEFLDATTVLPPGVWDPATRIEPPLQIASQDSRKKPDPKKFESIESASEILTKSFDISGKGRLFGGLIDDIKRKAPWYCSDFKDILALQCISSIVFLYFACITQVITFGGLLARATENKIAASECLLSALICGVVYSLFSGQPLTLLGSTGPILVFERIVYDVCKSYSIDYLSMRVWIGLWTALYLFILVAFNLTCLVKYITRFTEEIFATLVSVYFIYKAFLNVIQIEEDFPIQTSFHPPPVPVCLCLTPTSAIFNVTSTEVCQNMNGTSVPMGCSYASPFYVPDIFLMSVILFIGTFALILLLRALKNTAILPAKIRVAIADFSVLISVIFMTILDYFAQIKTPKLEVPQTFSPTLTERNWLIPVFGTNEWWTALLALGPAILLTASVFMDQEITTLIVNRKENKLKKGYGYHLDLLILAILFVVCSLLGLPWFVAATVLSITHVNSLKYASKCSTPGEKPQFIGVREQRMTHFAVYLLIGISFLFTHILQFIPMPVLYGVFLFMGVTSLKGLQFFERILIMFMPEKYQPDYSYLRRVPSSRVHIFTILQLTLFGLLFCCKLSKIASIAFPFLLLGVMFTRKGLGCVFDKAHLKVLDDVMPERKQIKKGDKSAGDENSSSLSEVVTDGENSGTTIAMNNVNTHANINISEVLAQSSIWKSINQQTSKATKKFLVAKTKKKKRCKRDAAKSEEHRRLSVMEEEEEDNTNTSVSLSPSQPPSVPSESASPDSKTETTL